MNLIEAIKTNKPIRRTNKYFGETFGFVKNNFNGAEFFYYNISMPLTLEDLLADDWIVKSEPMEIWVNYYEKHESYFIHTSEDDAKTGLSYGGVTKKFIEVIDE